jgi:branched-chain amino acid transport system permease protein
MWYASHVFLIQQTLVQVVVVCSIQITLRAGILSFASIGFYSVAEYITAVGISHHVPLVGTLLLGCIGSLIGGVLIGLIFSRIRGLYLGMATFAVVLIVGVVALNGGSLTGGVNGLFNLDVSISTPVIGLIVVLTLVMMRRLERQSFGRLFAVVRMNEELAGSLGVEVGRFRLAVFGLSGLLGGLAGGLHVAITAAATPTDAGFSLVVLSLTMAVVGGVETWLGAVVGAVLVTWLPDWLGSSDQWEGIAYGVIVLIVVIYARDGLVGLGRRLVVRVSSWQRVRGHAL